MRLRHTLACLGLAGVLVTGGAATARVITSDLMSKAITGPHVDEAFIRHADNNGDDIGVVSLAGLEVQIELPKELVEPIEPVRASSAVTA
jgi:hypothetical protein